MGDYFTSGIFNLWKRHHVFSKIRRRRDRIEKEKKSEKRRRVRTERGEGKETRRTVQARKRVRHFTAPID
jgi:hypothetical protein